MEENNRKGPGIFYAVTGVATLVVAIIGATFAYFSAVTAPNTEITGTTAEIEAMELDVTPIIDPEALLVPQYEAAIEDAIVGSEKGKCVDENGNGVCKVYRIDIKNPGSAAIASKGTLKLEAADGTSAFTNLKWALITAGVSGKTTADVTVTAEQLAVNTGFTQAQGASEIAKPLLAVNDSAEGTGDDEAVYYVVVWLEESGQAEQQKVDHGTFKGTVTWEGADGAVKVTSTFVTQ